MRPNLIPTVITNKNGVATTVHKKPVSASTASAHLPIPAAPVSPTTTPAHAHRDDLIAEMHQHLGVTLQGMDLGTGKSHRDAVLDIMDNASDSAVAALHDYVMRDMGDDRTQRRHRDDFLKALNVLAEHSPPATGATIHEYLTFKEALPLTNTLSPHQSLAIIKALHDYPQLPTMDDYVDADEDTRRKVTALLSVTDKLLDGYSEKQQDIFSASAPSSGAPWDYPELTMPTPLELGLPLELDDYGQQDPQKIRLHGDDLVSLITEHPDSADDIAKYIVRDGISDSALLRERLESKTPSLRDGLI